VLVHGAWHGGGCWRRVADLLQKRGHKVFTPTLAGVGERSHLMSKDIVLNTHITDIVNVIKWEDLNEICLVAHSYGGWPGFGALDQLEFTPPFCRQSPMTAGEIAIEGPKLNKVGH
jgi:alpha-beta hydrolase superfamily lysophospholipase